MNKSERIETAIYLLASARRQFQTAASFLEDLTPYRDDMSMDMRFKVACLKGSTAVNISRIEDMMHLLEHQITPCDETI